MLLQWALEILLTYSTHFTCSSAWDFDYYQFYPLFLPMYQNSETHVFILLQRMPTPRVQSRPGHSGRTRFEDHAGRWLRWDSWLSLCGKQFRVPPIEDTEKVQAGLQCLSWFLQRAHQYCMVSGCVMEGGMGQVRKAQKLYATLYKLGCWSMSA